jgi:hypothetical protein
MEKEQINFPDTNEDEKLKNRNKAHLRGMEELNNMISIDEEEKKETKEAIVNKAKETYEKQTGEEYEEKKETSTESKNENSPDFTNIKENMQFFTNGERVLEERKNGIGLICKWNERYEKFDIVLESSVASDYPRGSVKDVDSLKKIYEQIHSIIDQKLSRDPMGKTKIFLAAEKKIRKMFSVLN